MNKRRLYFREWQRRKFDKAASIPDKRKVQCLICKRWYIQLGTHVVQRHGYKSARQYREDFNLEVRKGTIPTWYKKMKGDLAIKNKTYLNLKEGKKFRFKKGEKGVGVYKRSPITLERVSKLGKEHRQLKRSKLISLKLK